MAFPEIRSHSYNVPDVIASYACCHDWQGSSGWVNDTQVWIKLKCLACGVLVEVIAEKTTDLNEIMEGSECRR